MGSYIERFWTSTVDGTGLRTRDRASGKYRAYLPDLLASRSFSLDEATSNDVELAARAIARFDSSATTLTDTEALARLLLRAECVASSNIEGLWISPQRLLRADAELQTGKDPRDDTARAVLGNIAAMQRATQLQGALSVDSICAIHAELFRGSRYEKIGGVVRPSQNWIGGSAYNPLDAAFVPPPEDHVHALLDDLCEFANRTDLPAIVQAAIVHAQFETIHPFADGNGRTGRTLMYVTLRKRGLAEHAIPPISLVLSTHVQEYIGALKAYQSIDGDPTLPQHAVRIIDWVSIFAAAASSAVTQAQIFEERIHTIVDRWRTTLGTRRAHAGGRRLIEHLASHPVLTIAAAAEILSVSSFAASNAIADLVEAGILVKRSTGRRNQVFEAHDVINAFVDLERSLASVDHDTNVSPPVRAVPARRTRRKLT